MKAFSQGYLTIGPAGPMTHMNVNNGMFVPTQPHPHMIQAAGASIAGGQPGGQPQVNVDKETKDVEKEVTMSDDKVEAEVGENGGADGGHRSKI